MKHIFRYLSVLSLSSQRNFKSVRYGKLTKTDINKYFISKNTYLLRHRSVSLISRKVTIKAPTQFLHLLTRSKHNNLPFNMYNLYKFMKNSNWTLKLILVLFTKYAVWCYNIHFYQELEAYKNINYNKIYAVQILRLWTRECWLIFIIYTLIVYWLIFSIGQERLIYFLIIELNKCYQLG